MPRRKIEKVRGISVRPASGRKLWRIWFNLYGLEWSESHKVEAIARAAAKVYGQRLAKGENICPARLREPKVKPELAAIPGTVRAEANAWIIERQRRKAGGTSDLYVSHLTHHIYPLLGDIPVTTERLTRRVCIDFAKALVGRVSERTKKPLAFNTRLGIVRCLGVFCQAARDNHPETFGQNPADDLVEYVTDPDELPRPEKYWTHAEAERLLETALRLAPHWYAYLYFAIRTGVRVGEQIELRWDEDFHVEDHVDVQRQFKRRRRKTYAQNDRGEMVGEVDEKASRIVPTKGKKRRLIQLRPDVQRMLKHHRTAQRAWALEHGVPAPELVFLGEKGGRVYITWFEHDVLPMLCKAAKVKTVTSSIHTTRHTFATVLLNAGVELAQVSKWLGHASEKTTETIYKHAIRDPRRDKVIGALVDEAWGAAR